MIYDQIRKLVEYGLSNGLIDMEDVDDTTNSLLDLFRQDDFQNSQELSEIKSSDFTPNFDGKALRCSDAQIQGTANKISEGSN